MSRSLFLLSVLSEFALRSAANHTGMPHHFGGMPCSRWAVKFFQNPFRTGSFASGTGRVVTPFLKDARQESRPGGKHVGKSIQWAQLLDYGSRTGGRTTIPVPTWGLGKLVLAFNHSTRGQEQSPNSHMLLWSLTTPDVIRAVSVFYLRRLKEASSSCQKAHSSWAQAGEQGKIT